MPIYSESLTRRLAVIMLLACAAAGCAGGREDGVTDGKVMIYNARTGKAQEVERFARTEGQWKAILSPERYKIMRQNGTEAPSAAACYLPREEGLYKCAGCGTDLFAAGAKFESGTGWPSFWEPVSQLNTAEAPDNSFGMSRVEVACARCRSHLGHVFNDGPPPTGKRYCINSLALEFEPVKAKLPDRAIFAAGCFWGVEEVFRRVEGVISVRSGFTGGDMPDPSYEDVCTGQTGHAEAVMVEYDPDIVSYERLLDIFWSIHDPTTLNRQGPDMGTQYRSAIFYIGNAQEKAASQSKDEIEKSGKFKERIVTEVEAAGPFYQAQEYHQGYFRKRGIEPVCHIPLPDGKKKR